MEDRNKILSLFLTLMIIYTYIVLGLPNRLWSDVMLQEKKAYSSVILEITPVINGETINTGILVSIINITGLNNKQIYLGVRNKVSFSVHTRFVKQNFGPPESPYIRYVPLPHSFMVVVYHFGSGSAGTRIVSIFPEEPVVYRKVVVKLVEGIIPKRNINPQAITKILEESKTSYAYTKISRVNTIIKSKAKITFPKGSCVYIQGKYRFDDRKPLESSWVDAGVRAVPATSKFWSGWYYDGASRIIKVYTKYRYLRYRLEEYGEIIGWEEHIFPVELPGGLKTKSSTCPACNNKRGEAYPVGNEAGSGRDFYLFGKSGYYWVPAASVSFSVSYPDMVFCIKWSSRGSVGFM